MEITKKDGAATICRVCGRPFSDDKDRLEHERAEHPRATPELSIILEIA